jgi:YesN/AraC family two-component response regulator
MTEQGNSVVKVLLVEDHPLLRLGLKNVLGHSADITVVGEAANGEEAIEASRRLMPDVILMDVGMPVMDGIQASKVIITENPRCCDCKACITQFVWHLNACAATSFYQH